MSAFIGHIAPPEVHVMTFNIRRRMGAATMRRADRWPERAPRMHALLRRERPALLGAQEVLPDQAMIMLHALGPGYAFVGYGRDAHRAGEACPIFYDTDRLKLLDWSQTALSDRPDEHASRTWGNPLSRVLVTATFRDRATAVEFVAMNTHLDPFSRRSRIRSARHIRECAALRTIPVIVTGDMNSRPGSTPLRALLYDRALRDTWDTASVRLSPEWGTLARYRPARANGRRLDLIAVSRTIEVERVGIDALPVDGGWPSDHLPVQAVLRLPTPAAA